MKEVSNGGCSAGPAGAGERRSAAPGVAELTTPDSRLPTREDDWPLVERAHIGDFRIFSIHRDVRTHPRAGTPYPFYRLHSTDWVNVVALTPAPDPQVVLVRQFRAGIEAPSLEIPGGMVDPGETPAAAAARELLEETGCVAGAVEELGWVHPNPALFDNRCWTFLARDVRPGGPPRPDQGEVIEVETAPLAAIPGLIAARQITHALVVAAFYLLFGRDGWPGREAGAPDRP
jgi:ADP-ribose pyrophosphatase